MIAVPAEASAFLGIVGAFLVLLVVFYLYLNKKFCFTTIGGFPCCDKPLSNQREPATKDLGTAFAYEEVESSTDSEDEVLQRLQHSTSLYSGLRKVGGTMGDESYCGRQPIKNTFSSSNIIQDKCSTSGNYQDHLAKVIHGDPISLVEKGRVENAGSASSFSSETSIGETREDTTAISQPLITDNSSHHFENGAFQNIIDSPEVSNHTFSGFEETMIDNDEHLFDVSDLNSTLGDQEPGTGTRCGALEVKFSYDMSTRKLTVNVIQAQDLPSRDRGGANHVQVRILLLPHKRQKYKTKIRNGSNLQFNETFIFSRISPEEINNMGLRFRLYGCERMRREHLIGESIIPFSSMNLEENNAIWLMLEPRSNLAHSDSKTDISSLARSDSTGSTHSMQHGGLPELLLGLAYNGTTGRLSVEVIKGSHFHNVSLNRAPDTYVKLSLVSSSGQEIARSKTSVRRGQPNPLFKETFVFQVALFQLPDVTLMVSVYNKRSMKRKEMIGWFSLGLNSSGEEELAHWNDMRENKGEQVCHWHILLET